MIGTVTSFSPHPDGRPDSLAPLRRSQGRRFLPLVWVVLGFVIAGVLLLPSIAPAYVDLFSFGWGGIAIATVWLVGFPLLVWAGARRRRW